MHSRNTQGQIARKSASAEQVRLARKARQPERAARWAIQLLNQSAGDGYGMRLLCPTYIERGNGFTYAGHTRAGRRRPSTFA